MARRSGGGGNPIINAVMAVLVIILTLVIITETGAWAKMVEVTGLKGLNPLTSSQQMKPDAQHRTLGPNLQTPRPTTPATPTPRRTEAAAPTQKPANKPSASGRQAPTGLPKAAYAPIDTAKALRIAKDTPTAAPHTGGYDRAGDFGEWANSPGLCGYGTTRDQILRRDLSDTRLDGQCRVTSGILKDPYTATTIRFQRTVMRGRVKVSGDSAAVQIDHVVSVNDAWASGLWKESRRGDRVRYYNDPDVLLASQGDANNEKSMGVNLSAPGEPSSLRGRWKASTPSIWLPSNRGYQCAYMAKRVWVKHKYGLTMSPWERSETVRFLSACPA